MDIKVLSRSDWIIIDSYLALDQAMNARDLSNRITLSYATCVESCRNLWHMHILKKVAYGKYRPDKDNPIVFHIGRIREIEYNPGVPMDDPRAVNMVYVPKSDSGEKSHRRARIL